MAVGLVVVLAIGAATPQGRAAGAQLLRFAGVEFSNSPGPAPVPSPRLPGETRMSLEEARGIVAFALLVPTALGQPEEITVSDEGRVVSLDYGDVRLDEFDGKVNEVFFQKFLHGSSDMYKPAKVNGIDAIWINGPHEIWYVDKNGFQHTESAHTSGKTLIWQSGDTALRLEGVTDRETAIRVAESAH